MVLPRLSSSSQYESTEVLSGERHLLPSKLFRLQLKLEVARVQDGNGPLTLD